MKALFTQSMNLLPEMGFERQLMAASDLTLDQVRFFVALVGSLFAGFLIRLIPGSKGASQQCRSTATLQW